MTHNHLSRRLEILEQGVAAARAVGGCRCPDSALCVAANSRVHARCPRCHRARTLITIRDLPAATSAPIPTALLAALQRASGQSEHLDLTQLSDHELDQLLATLRALDTEPAHDRHQR